MRLPVGIGTRCSLGEGGKVRAGWLGDESLGKVAEPTGHRQSTILELLQLRAGTGAHGERHSIIQAHYSHRRTHATVRLDGTLCTPKVALYN